MVDAQLASRVKAPVTPTTITATELEKAKTASEEKTGFLRYRPRKYKGEDESESSVLSCAETMVMLAGHDKIDHSKIQHRQHRSKKTPQVLGAGFKQISMITYGLYKGEYAHKMGNFGGETRVDNERIMTPERATQILEQCKPKLSDEELEIEYNKWIRSRTFPPEETLVFQVWMQCVHDKQNNVAARFGRDSPIYRSLIGCFRGAIFHTLMEQIILFDEIKPATSQPVNSQLMKVRKTSDSTGNNRRATVNYQEVFAGEMRKMQKPKYELLSSMYADHFRSWIRTESGTGQYRAAATVYDEFERLPNWHAFWGSSWPKISDTLCCIWYGGGGGDEFPVYTCDHHEQLYKQADPLKALPTCPGEYPEVVILMKEPAPMQPQTPQTAGNPPVPKKPTKKKLSLFGKKEHNSCCALVALERHGSRMKLVLYAFNVKDDILSKIRQTLKNAVNMQVMRNQFMAAAMKLKLGLYHELHHGLTSELINGSNLSSTNLLTVPDKIVKMTQRKSHSNIKGDRRRQLITLDNVIKNSVEMELKNTQRQYSFFVSQQAVKELVHCAADMPTLSREERDDHVTSQARQISRLKETEAKRKEIYETSSNLLKAWEESFSLGKDPAKDPDSQLDDLMRLKRLSKVEFTACSKVLFRSILIANVADRNDVDALAPSQIRKRVKLPDDAGFRPRAGAKSGPAFHRNFKKVDFTGVTPSPQRSQERLDRAQRRFLYDELNAHLEKRLAQAEFTLRRVNLGSTETENGKCYFQVCRKRSRALLVEVNCDYGTNTIHFVVYSFNLELFDYHLPNQDHENKSKALQNDMAISFEVDLIRRNIRMRQFVATFHLKLVYKELINAFDRVIRDHQPRPQKKPLHGPDNLADPLFDYPSYFEQIKSTYETSDFNAIAFDKDIVDINYKHNTPPDEFFNYFVNDADKREKLNKIGVADVRFIKFEPHDRKFILAKHRFEKHGFDAVCLIYHDYREGTISQLKLVYWVIVVGIEKHADIDYNASIRQVKDYINSPDYGLAKRFYDVGERCYKGN